MIRLSAEASRQIDQLLTHYASLDRPEAARHLRSAIDQAAERIARNPEAGLTAPRPYSDVSRTGVSWIKVHRYWIAYAADASVILAVFFDEADIPGRF